METNLYTPWGVPYFGPVEHGPGDLLWFWHEGMRYPLRPEFAKAVTSDSA